MIQVFEGDGINHQWVHYSHKDGWGHGIINGKRDGDGKSNGDGNDNGDGNGSGFMLDNKSCPNDWDGYPNGDGGGVGNGVPGTQGVW